MTIFLISDQSNKNKSLFIKSAELNDGLSTNGQLILQKDRSQPSSEDITNKEKAEAILNKEHSQPLPPDITILTIDPYTWDKEHLQGVPGREGFAIFTNKLKTT